MKLTIIAGARPNFMKIAPLVHEIHRLQQEGADISYRLVHTGQHYHPGLSDVFFKELEIPHPHINLEVGSGSQAEQTAHIMIRFEKELLQYPADLVIVVGDVNSTMACTIVAKKLDIRVAHVEAGIRSFDLSMPEEINRMVTDAICDYFFTTSVVAGDNLIKAGIRRERIFFVGNIMIDTLVRNLPKLKQPAWFSAYGLSSASYMVMTLHRPSNVDNPRQLRAVIETVAEASGDRQILFPVHPRTRKAIEDMGLGNSSMIQCDPLGYLEFNYLVKNSGAVITDSGGIQEETTFLGIPCITLRKNTERPETVTTGTNVLVGDNLDMLKTYLGKVFENSWKKGSVPELWDGNTANRIMTEILRLQYR
ncbi:MAG: UDP-N-acetylglucosamine 2-epimerase (non-hydrolyzing) [Sphingobacteriales bacterium]|nr:MAG: UDP-N-acetylglucosamine 2-epimerase (non-hydrolyzing) [Sphingobacteriales bacterium]